MEFNNQKEMEIQPEQEIDVQHLDPSQQEIFELNQQI
jgi:hypothetical protein